MQTPAAIKSQLYEAWMSLVGGLGVPETEAHAVWLDLAVRYEENGRFYHTFVHIHHLLEIIGMVRDEVEDETAVLFAVWFHDVIYNPRAKNNEQLSQQYARQRLSAWQLPASLIEKVSDLILATEKHVPFPQASHDCLIFLDADLAILGAAPEVYERYAQQIRQEYFFVPDDIFRKERCKVLKMFIDRGVIYFTESMKSRFQERAYQNLTWELAKWQ